MLHEFSGASVRTVIDRSGARVPEHAHEWPLLSLFVMGSYSNRTEMGEQFIEAPSAVLYAAGAAHCNTAGPGGFEQIEIEFDPAWLRSGCLPAAPVVRWSGGRSGAEARAIALLCSQGVSEQPLRATLRRFLQAACMEAHVEYAGWLDRVTRSLKDDPARKVSKLASAVGLHPSWLGTAYKRATGEGLADAAARFRVERAARLLRETALPCAEIAIEAGFCDQSHMIRTFRRVLGRLPSAVREDRRHFRQVLQVP
ncbi:MAG: helix-turn-helix domain-containing protein [Steroidobacteraceae bacterium]